MCQITKSNICSEELMKRVPKSDLHNHASYGGNFSYVSKYFDIGAVQIPSSFDKLEDMTQWFNDTFGKKGVGVNGYIRRIQAAFIQAREDSIELLIMSFGKREIDTFGGIISFSRIVQMLHKRYAPDSIFFPELSLKREEEIQGIMPWLEEVFEAKWFLSIDISGKENAREISQYIPIYRLAEKYHMILKAHVGEFGVADDIRKAVELLHLKEVHHGIAAIDSHQLMKWLARERVQLNVCVTSNIILKRVADYKIHPVRTFFDYGIPVTINTDDMLIFNSSVSEEYIKLYNCGLFSVEELDGIRKTGLNSIERYCSYCYKVGEGK